MLISFGIGGLDSIGGRLITAIVHPQHHRRLIGEDVSRKPQIDRAAAAARHFIAADSCAEEVDPHRRETQDRVQLNPLGVEILLGDAVTVKDYRVSGLQIETLSFGRLQKGRHQPNQDDTQTIERTLHPHAHNSPRELVKLSAGFAYCLGDMTTATRVNAAATKEPFPRGIHRELAVRQILPRTSPTSVPAFACPDSPFPCLRESTISRPPLARTIDSSQRGWSFHANCAVTSTGLGCSKPPSASPPTCSTVQSSCGCDRSLRE